MTSPAPNISEPITLEAVKSRFHQWRASRSKRSKVPECLWDDVRQLSKSYNYSQLSSQLRISYQQLHTHLKEGDQQHNNHSSPESNFINAHMPLSQWSSPSSDGVLEIQGGHGLSLKATGLNHQDLLALVQTFLKNRLG
jgi:hypothetical protein